MVSLARIDKLEDNFCHSFEEILDEPDKNEHSLESSTKQQQLSKKEENVKT